MIKLKYFLFYAIFFSFLKVSAQHLYYRSVPKGVLKELQDSTQKIAFNPIDSSIVYKEYFNYVLKFFPTTLYQQIKVSFTKSASISKTKFTFSSIFKRPEKRVYKIYFGKNTKTMLDSASINNIELDSQIGLIGREIATVEDFSTSGFFDFVAWYFRRLSTRAKNKIAYNADMKTLEVGLGHQLLSLVKETDEKLAIENWKDTKGYSAYIKTIKNRYMPAETVSNFLNDMPVYVSKVFK
jgi:hypothetical protein